MLACAVIDSCDGKGAEESEEDLRGGYSYNRVELGYQQIHAMTAKTSSSPKLLTIRARQ